MGRRGVEEKGRRNSDSCRQRRRKLKPRVKPIGGTLGSVENDFRSLKGSNKNIAHCSSPSGTVCNFFLS